MNLSPTNLDASNDAELSSVGQIAARGTPGRRASDSRGRLAKIQVFVAGDALRPGVPRAIFVIG